MIRHFFKLAWRRKDFAGATAALVDAFTSYRSDPWSDPEIIGRSLQLAVRVAGKDKALGARLYDALGPVFAVYNSNLDRARARLELAHQLGGGRCLEALVPFEPFVPWNLEFLERRVACYQLAQDPRKTGAELDVATFRSEMPRSLFEAGEPPPPDPGEVGVPHGADLP